MPTAFFRLHGALTIIRHLYRITQNSHSKKITGQCSENTVRWIVWRKMIALFYADRVTKAVIACNLVSWGGRDFGGIDSAALANALGHDFNCCAGTFGHSAKVTAHRGRAAATARGCTDRNKLQKTWQRVGHHCIVGNAGAVVINANGESHVGVTINPDFPLGS